MSMKSAPRGLRLALIAALVGLAGFFGYRWLDHDLKSVEVTLTPEAIPADGVSSALLEVRLTSRFGNRLNATILPFAPQISIVEGSSLVRVIPLDDSLRYRLVAGFDRGRVVIRVRVAGLPAPYEEVLLLTPSLADHNHNGYPDAVDLTSDDDRAAFRKWFVAIALGQLEHLDDQWQDRDCAGLLRYCYREALKRHDNRWLRARRWLVSAAIPDVSKYNYPDVPLLGTRVFGVGREEDFGGGTLEAERADRIEPGSIRDDGIAGGISRDETVPVSTTDAIASRVATDESHESIRSRDSRAARSLPSSLQRQPGRRNDGRGSGIDLDRFATFAEASRLKDNSMAFISRDVADAEPGDVLFYLNDTRSSWPYHTMIYIGRGATVYHTGPDGDDPGIVKRMTLAQLAAHPNPRWHPVASNAHFLGYYRWRLLL